MLSDESLELLFKIFNLIALIAWIPMLLIPGNKIYAGIVQRRILPTGFSMVYLMLFTYLIASGIIKEMDFSSLEKIQSLFQYKAMALLGWVHYLAFDLFVGSWEMLDAKKRKIPGYFLAPALLLTFMLGPIGWLCYLLLRQFYPYSEHIN